MLIDTHCHLTDKKFSEDLEEVIGRAEKAGVSKIVVPSINLDDAKRAIEIANKFEGIYALVGIHPESIPDSQFSALEQIEKLKELIRASKKVVGVGEIGLDFYWDREKKTELKQIELFENQLKLAMELNLPVVIHNRLAEDEIKRVFESLDKLPRGQFHCWSGNRDFLEYVLDKGFYVSFCGNITYKSNEHLRNLLKITPINRLLLETDSPYLAPEPVRGRINEPVNVKITAGFMADTLGLSIDSLINRTRKNSLCLFPLER